LALKNPLAYYTPGIPGRGAGTILKQPDLSGYAARQMKLTDLKLKQKQDDDALKAKKLSDIITVDGDIWLNDQKYFDDRINEFQKEAISVWSKSNGNPDAVSLAKLKQKQAAIESEMKESKFHEQQRKEAIPKIEAFAATNKYDDQDITDAFNKWEEWSKLTPAERSKQTPQNVLNQPFNWVTYNDKSIVKPATSKPEKAAYYTTATIGGKERPVVYTNEVYTTKQASDDLWRHIGQGGKYETGAIESYNAWLNQNPNKTYSYIEIGTTGVGNNKRIVETQKDVQINSFEDWVNNVQASQNSFNRLGANVGSGSSSTSFGFGIPQTSSQAGQKVAEMVVKGGDGSQYGFAATTYSSLNGYNIPKQAGGKIRTGTPIPGSYSTEKEKNIDYSYSGDMVVNDHYKLVVATEDIPLTLEQASVVNAIDPNALTPDKKHLKKGAPIPTQYRDEPIFNGKTDEQDWITYSIITKYDLAGNPITQRQYTVNASTPQTRNWLDMNMIEQKGKKFTEWYFGWKPSGTGATNTGAKTSGKTSSSGGTNWSQYKRK
jgi:hypothetical protein